MPIKFKILFICLCSTFCVSAQNAHPYFRNYTTDDGLPSSEVHYCLQDKEGYMWFATDNGVSRFDGYEFTNFGSGEGLKHNVVFYLQLDPQGRIWIATMHGHLYYVEGNSIHAFSQNDIIEASNDEFQFITDFYIDKQGNKFISIRELGILFLGTDASFELLQPLKSDINKMAIHVDERWIVSSTKISDAKRDYYSKNEKLRFIPTDVEIRTDSIFYLKNFHLLKNSSGSGSMRWMKSLDNNQNLVFYQYGFRLLENKKEVWNQSIKVNVNLKAALENEDGQWVMGSQFGGGLRHYKNLQDIRFNNYQQYLEGISVSALCKDSKGGYWVSTLENGVFYCPDIDLNIYDQSSGLPSNHITAFDFKNEKELFIGLRNGNVIQFNTETNQSLPLASSSKNIIYDLLWIPNREELWMTDGGLNAWNSNNWQDQIKHKKQKSAFSYNVISKKLSLNKDQDKLWGGSYYGFGAFDLNKKSFVYASRNHGIVLRVLRIWEDKQDRIWVGTVNGLYEYKDSVLLRPEPYATLLTTRIEDIAELEDGTLILATKGAGLLLWDGKRIQQISKKDGLTSDMLENVHVDNFGQIWAGTLLGLNKIVLQKNDVTVESFTVANGLPSNEITVIKSHNGQLWVGTNKGLVQWKESSKQEDAVIPILQGTRVNNEYLNLTINNKLKYWQNDLQFNFLSINYKLNGKIPYRFRLNGGNWNNTFNRSVNFAGLPPGDYTFEVQSQNEEGLWSASNQQQFIIQSPIWQTLWFKLLLTALVAYGIWWFYRYRVGQIREEARIKQEMNELRSSALRAQMNPHFIFNCLNSIQNFIAQNDKANAAHYLARFAQLVRRALNASRETVVSLEEEIELLEDYLVLEQLRFKKKFDYVIEVNEQLNLFETEIPPMLTQPYVENAIIHGLGQTQNKGKIVIRFYKTAKALIIEIEDNGSGIYQTQNPNTDKKLYQSVGMKIPKDRIKLLNPANRVEISEVKNDGNERNGTLIRLVLKQ